MRILSSSPVPPPLHHSNRFLFSSVQIQTALSLLLCNTETFDRVILGRPEVFVFFLCVRVEPPWRMTSPLHNQTLGGEKVCRRAACHQTHKPIYHEWVKPREKIESYSETQKREFILTAASGFLCGTDESLQDLASNLILKLLISASL